MTKVAILLMALAAIVPLSHADGCDEYYSYFICGHVDDAEDGTPAPPRTVKLYIPDDESRNVLCTIMLDPEYYDGNYCCRPCDIPGLDVEIMIGKNLSSGVLDDGSGYVAGPVNTTVTQDGVANGIDVAPLMALSPALVIYSPQEGASYPPIVSLIAGLRYPYHLEIRYRVDEAAETLACERCSYIQVPLSLPLGPHTIAVRGLGYDGASIERSVHFTVRAGGSPFFRKPLFLMAEH